jgi:flagellar hook-basal body complex protein FliE
LAIEGPTLPMLAPHARIESLPLRESKDAAEGAAGAAVFEDLLKNMALSTNQRINEAQSAGEAFAAGQRDDIHGTMLTLSKADIELRVLGNVRNRVIDAFYELWRMQI